jgi:hypothetical protein
MRVMVFICVRCGESVFGLRRLDIAFDPELRKTGTENKEQ